MNAYLSSVYAIPAINVLVTSDERGAMPCTVPYFMCALVNWTALPPFKVFG